MNTLHRYFSSHRAQLLAACLGLAVSGLVACGSDDDAKVNPTEDAGKTSTQDAGKSDTEDSGKGATKDAGSGGACVKSPKTHVEIINACTDADFIDKDPKLPLLLTDGGLPPLP